MKDEKVKNIGDILADILKSGNWYEPRAEEAASDSTDEALCQLAKSMNCLSTFNQWKKNLVESFEQLERFRPYIDDIMTTIAQVNSF